MFSDLDYQPTYVPGIDPSDALLGQVAMSIPNKEQALWLDQLPDESIYEAATEMSDEEWDDEMLYWDDAQTITPAPMAKMYYEKH